MLIASTLSPTPRAAIVFGLLTWGFAALHPRLYAVTRYAGSTLTATLDSLQVPFQKRKPKPALS